MTAAVNIVDVATVRERMALQNLAEVNTLISSGLTAAQAFFEAILGSQFDEVVDQNNVFFLDSNLHYPYAEMFKMRLKRMFLVSASVVVYAGATRKIVLESDAEVVETEDYDVDYEKGIVSIVEGYADTFIRIKFSSGFDASANPAPEWMKEAILAYMPSVVINQNPSNVAPNAEKLTLEIKKMAAGLVDGHLRPLFPPQFNPLY